MANIKKFGQAVVITSAAKLEEIKKIAKYNPDALVLKKENEDGVKEPVFCVGISAKDRSGSVGTYGIEFGSADENGYAQVTLDYTGPDVGVKEALADSLGRQIVMLNALEATFGDALEQIDRDVAAIMTNIEVG